jgi:hypothetical protein
MTIGWRRPQPPDGEDGQQDGDREHHAKYDGHEDDGQAAATAGDLVWWWDDGTGSANL